MDVRRWDTSMLKDTHYSWRVGCVGYESRARFFFEEFASDAEHSVALMFDEQQVLEFDRNRKMFAGMGFNFISISSDQTALEVALQQLFEAILQVSKKENLTVVRILIDVSSMTRQMIALIALNAANIQGALDVECDFVYSPASFGELPDVEGPILSNGPVCDQLAGWSPTVGVPCGLVLGIGYEPDLALGVIEDLEAGEVWAFRPYNSDKKYDVAINDHNQGLDQHIPNSNYVRYFIYDPYYLYIALGQLVRSAKYEYRTIIVPLGPKIFSLCATLVTLSNYPDVGLWRVSAGPNLTPVDRKPTGEVFGIKTIFRHRGT